MKTPTKAELYAQNAILSKQLTELQEKLDAEKLKHWRSKVDDAFAVCREMIPFPNGIIQFLTLEHIDDVGYWFTFELIGYITKQTYCVRHTDIKTTVVKNELYIVYGQDMEGRDVTPHYFFDKQCACEYAIASKGKIAYNIPTVCQITIVYNTENIDVNRYAHNYHTLSEDDIKHYAKGDDCK